MMKQMAGQFGFGGRSATRRQAKGRKGKKQQQRGRGPRPAARAHAGSVAGSRRRCSSCRRASTSCPPTSTSSKLKFPKGK